MGKAGIGLISGLSLATAVTSEIFGGLLIKPIKSILIQHKTGVYGMRSLPGFARVTNLVPRLSVQHILLHVRAKKSWTESLGTRLRVTIGLHSCSQALPAEYESQVPCSLSVSAYSSLLNILHTNDTSLCACGLLCRLICEV